MPYTEEFKCITKNKNLQEGLTKVELYENNIIIKDGENEAYLWNGKELITKLALLNTNVVDCIGVVDSFDAGFINDYIKGTNFEKCVEMFIDILTKNKSNVNNDIIDMSIISQRFVVS